MDWSSLPPRVLESIFYHTAKLEQNPDWSSSEEWLGLLCKLGKVCIEWRNAISLKKSNSVSTHGSTCQRLIEAGLMNKIKKVYIKDPKHMKMLVEHMDQCSLSAITLPTRAEWSDETIDLLLKFLSSCSKLTTVLIRFEITDQRTAVWYWKILLKAVHCNQYPKRLVSELVFLCKSVNWGFVKDMDFNGPGSISHLQFSLDCNSVAMHKHRPDWTHFTDAISIDRVNTVYIFPLNALRFIETLNAKRCNIIWCYPSLTDSMLKFFNNFESLSIHFEYVYSCVSRRSMHTIIEKIDHSDAHAVWTDSPNCFTAPDENLLSAWARAFQNSSIKTLEFTHTQTIFDCDDSLLDNWIDHAQGYQE